MMRVRTLPLSAFSLALLTAAAISGCSAAPDGQVADSVPSVALPDTPDASEFAWSEVAPAEAGLLYSIEGLSSPEAVKYYPEGDLWIISNWGESGEGNDGFLSLAFASDGMIATLYWARGTDADPLLQPRGMAIQGDSLWVADVRGLHQFLLKDASHMDFIDLSSTDPGFLNDVAIGADGAVYVTDSSRSRITRVKDGQFSIVAEGDELGSPNGITFDPVLNELVIVPWVGGDTLRTWDPIRGVAGIARSENGGRFDGVEPFQGGLIVASQADSALHVVVGRQGRAFQRVPGRPADIAIDPVRRRVAVPYIALNRVDVYALPAGRADQGGR